MDDKVVLLQSYSSSSETDLTAPGKNTQVVFNADASLLASSTPDGRAYIWQLKNGEYKRIVELTSSPISSIAFSPNGEFLFLGETDQILVVDPLTGDEVNRIRQKGDVADLTFSPDGKMLYSAALRSMQYFDMLARQDISGDEIVTAACSRLAKNFNASEWTLFFENEEYRVLCESLPIP